MFYWTFPNQLLLSSCLPQALSDKTPTILQKYNMDNFRPNDYNLEKDTNNYLITRSIYQA